MYIYKYIYLYIQSIGGPLCGPVTGPAGPMDGLDTQNAYETTGMSPFYIAPLSYTFVYSPTYSLVLLFRTPTCFID
jgi:hypothetical protein